MHAVAGEVVLAATARPSAVAEVDRVERRTEVHEERIVTLDRRTPCRRPALGDRLVGDLVVVRDRLRADVVGGHEGVLHDLLVAHAVRARCRAVMLATVVLALGGACTAVMPLAAVLAPLAGLFRVVAAALAVDQPVHVVRLETFSFGLSIERHSGAAYRNELAPFLGLVPEPEPVADVGLAVAGVVDVDVVPRLLVELVEVRAAGRVLERNPVRHDRQRVLRVRRGVTHRRPCRRAVGSIERERRFPVAGAKSERHRHPDRHRPRRRSRAFSCVPSFGRTFCFPQRRPNLPGRPPLPSPYAAARPDWITTAMVVADPRQPRCVDRASPPRWRRDRYGHRRSSATCRRGLDAARRAQRSDRVRDRLRPPWRRRLLARLPDRGRPRHRRRRDPGGIPVGVAQRREVRPHARQRPHVAAGRRAQPRDRRAPKAGDACADRRASSWTACPSAGRPPSSPTPRRCATKPRARCGARSTTLPEDQLKVIELAYFGGLTHSEIAQALGMPLGTVKGRMRLAMEKIRATLAEGFHERERPRALRGRARRLHARSARGGGGARCSWRTSPAASTARRASGGCALGRRAAVDGRAARAAACASRAAVERGEAARRACRMRRHARNPPPALPVHGFATGSGRLPCGRRRH